MTILEDAETAGGRVVTESDRRQRIRNKTAVDLAILLNGLPYKDDEGNVVWRTPGLATSRHDIPRYYAVSIASIASAAETADPEAGDCTVRETTDHIVGDE